MIHWQKKKQLISALALSAALLLGSVMPVQAADRVQPVGDEIVIVIDPGHGGDNLGTQSGHTQEKEMTLVTAKAMFQELDLYDNVKVYMTRGDDTGILIKDRAKFAADVNADFLFSIHYNASEAHNMFGTEVWVSCETPYNAYGYQFGYLHMLSMRERGLFVRGVKTRIDNGEDYYGVLRYSAEMNIPAVIIEHCYVDEERDADYIKNADDWAEFGRMDALAVAKYFGLKSTALGVDYSAEAHNLQDVNPNVRVEKTVQDETPPDVCTLELTDCNYSTGAVTLTVSAADYDSPLLYYEYSMDGGQTWSRWETWPGCDALTEAYTDIFQLDLQAPDGSKPTIVLNAYNRDDLFTTSNAVTFDRAFTYGEEPEAVETAAEPESGEETEREFPDHARKSIGTTTFMPSSGAKTEEDESVGIMGFLKICLVLVIFVFIVVLISQIVSYSKRKKRRRDYTRRQ